MFSCCSNQYLILTGILIGIERKQKKLSQEQLSNKICSTRTLRNIEKGSTTVKDKTYEDLLGRLGYTFQTSQKTLSVFRHEFQTIHDHQRNGTYKDPLEQENQGSISKNLYEAMLSLFLCSLQKKSLSLEDQHKLIEFLTSGYAIFSTFMQDLILNYLFHYYESIHKEEELDKVVDKMRINHDHFPPHLLCCLARDASKRRYQTVLEDYKKQEKKWVEKGELIFLLMAQEILLIPIAFSEPDQLEDHIKKLQESFFEIKHKAVHIDSCKERDYYYNIGLSYTYAKKYDKAIFYLEMSCTLSQEIKDFILIDQILLNYARKRLDKRKESKLDYFTFYQPEHAFKQEYNYFYYKYNQNFSAKKLQKFILEYILPLNMEGSEILYQVFLYEMIELSHVTHSYQPLKTYIEKVNT
ncbi:helix-turn-helix domain-containing protein [Saccharibacillus alkalitolerans]|uniref:Helix-turn-helix transcriptional regulator n=1 Tax=Saccharibacillus alkalitolerans TaxID=2705290 RepID=A0ABX0FE86_9BACL|nr:helix-turn-helix transcriptional regulator [Saccharibacillus alkalitolerans]NGZ77187.1 helix-turn-helix transcriptional regulator [Saccharibacillus alkalitolerans]